MSTIGKILDAQFDKMWQMLREAVFNTPEAPWREGPRTSSGLARLAYHLVETVEYYIGETEKNFPFGKRLGIDIWEAATPTELPTKEQVHEYAEEVRKRTEALLGEADDTKFLKAQKLFQWTGETLLDRFIYILRHSYYHLGQMNTVIRTTGNVPIAWR